MAGEKRMTGGGVAVVGGGVMYMSELSSLMVIGGPVAFCGGVLFAFGLYNWWPAKVPDGPGGPKKKKPDDPKKPDSGNNGSKKLPLNNLEDDIEKQSKQAAQDKVIDAEIKVQTLKF
jgi:hypothetical protein